MTQLNDALVHIGPLSVSIDAAVSSFYFYQSGYYDDENCQSNLESLDHSVLAVGYVMYQNKKYTLIKNSWSTHWGEDGYIKIQQKQVLLTQKLSKKWTIQTFYGQNS